MSAPQMPQRKQVISKAEAIKILTDMRLATNPIIGNQTTIEALDCAIQEIGKCNNCSGTGQEAYDTRDNGGYKIKIDGKGKSWFVYSCGICNGSGKMLGIKCSSCGKEADILVGQRYSTHCYNCEKRLQRAGVLR